MRKIPGITVHFDLIAPIYDLFIRKPNLEKLHNLLKLPTEGWLLDAGGGTGRASSLLRDRTGGVIICDLSRPMLKQAQKRRYLRPILAPVECLPFPMASIERILVVDAFHHFREPKLAIKELLRVLKPGGRLVIEEQDIRRFPIKLVALAEKFLLMQSRFFSSAEITEMIRFHGLPVQVIKDGRFLFWVVVDR